MLFDITVRVEQYNPIKRKMEKLTLNAGNFEAESQSGAESLAREIYAHEYGTEIEEVTIVSTKKVSKNK